MRLYISFDQTVSAATMRPNKHALQGLIYALLNGTQFQDLHGVKAVKLFTFSDWFRSKDQSSYFILSSVNSDLIEIIYERLNDQIGNLRFLDYVLAGVEKTETPDTRFLKTASPIVLVRDTKTNECYSFKRKTLSIQDFDQLIKEGLVRRYRKHIGDEDFNVDGPLFEAMDMRNEIPVRLDIRGREFLVIGSTWNKLILARNKKRKQFYKWLIDVGIGQKTSLGFGCLQPYKLGGGRKHV